MWFFFFKQTTAYGMRISDWSSDVCSSDLTRPGSCQRARGTAAKRAAAADRLHDDAIGLIARRVDSRADGDVHRAAATRALWHRSSRKTAQHGPGRRSRIGLFRSEEHTSELQSLMRISSAVFCLKKQK